MEEEEERDGRGSQRRAEGGTGEGRGGQGEASCFFGISHLSSISTPILYRMSQKGLKGQNPRNHLTWWIVEHFPNNTLQ